MMLIMRAYYTIVTEELYDIVQGLLTLYDSCVTNDKKCGIKCNFSGMPKPHMAYCSRFEKSEHGYY